MARSGRILFVADLFQPVDHFAGERLGDGDMRHCRGRRGAVPMFLVGREPDHVAGPDLLDRASLALRPAAAGGDDQRLAQRVRVPGRAGARLEGDDRPADAGGIAPLERLVDADAAGEPFGRSFDGRLRTVSFDVQDLFLLGDWRQARGPWRCGMPAKKINRRAGLGLDGTCGMNI